MRFKVEPLSPDISSLSLSLSLADHETAIVHRLQEVILEHASSLLTVVELTAELDW